MNSPQEPSQNGGYRSKSSNFYNELAAASTQQQTCEIIYLDSQGKEILVISPVYDIYTESGLEYVRLDKENIPLDRITSVNGRRSNGEVDTELLEKGLQPNATPATPQHKYPEEETHTRTNSLIIEHTESVPADRALQTKDDFVHRFLTTPPPFLLGENDSYSFSADRLQNRLYLTIKKPWANPGAVSELGGYMEQVSTLIGPEFTLLNDLTNIAPDEEGTIWAVPIPNKDALLRHGLVKVADVVPLECETLVHSIDSFSVNSVRMRYFKNYASAEHWLTSEQEDTNKSGGASA